MGGDRDRDGRVDSRELLDRDRITQGVAARTTELLGERDPHQPQLGHLGDELVREAAFAVDLLGDGRDAVVGEGAHGVAEELLLGREVEIHASDGTRTARFKPTRHAARRPRQAAVRSDSSLAEVAASARTRPTAPQTCAHRHPPHECAPGRR